MYVPAHFAEVRLDMLHQLMHDYPLGTLITLEPSGLNASHIPFEITPAWYAEKKESGKVAPTYNYATVHAYGPLRVIDDAAGLHALLERLTNRHEATRAQASQISDVPPELIEKILPAIIGIEIRLTRAIGNWKVSQNRSDADRKTIATGLRTLGDDGGFGGAIALIFINPHHECLVKNRINSIG
ncbi:MAG: FMN-binding negative transcriptional regulator [Burkholderiaceae bacterium]